MWKPLLGLVAALTVACASAGEVQREAPDAADVPDACIPLDELCNDADDDCDGRIDEAFTDKGAACATGIGACERAGTQVCDGNALVCDAQPGAVAAESCNAIDDDCDGDVDEDFAVGTACDGDDADVCMDGMLVCDGPSAAICTDAPGAAVETCDSVDNDCDNAIDEGFDVGMPCDGADSDACTEGLIACSGGVAICADTTGDSVELCNAIDDDCRNGVDDPFPIGEACTVGLGACARTGSFVCNGAQTGAACSAVAGAPTPETCGNGADEDCNGTDAVCPPNDAAGAAIDISAGGTFSIDLAAARDDNWAQAPNEDCGDQGGRDVFYTFTLMAPEVVYFDTFGSSYDTVVRIFAGACTQLGAVQRCEDDACASTRSQGALQLGAGTYCLVVDQFSNAATTGATTLTFRRGGRTGTALTAASGTRTGSTTGKPALSIASCEANTPQPEDVYFFLTCPGTTMLSANTCSGTAFDTVLYVRSGAATSADVACNDDTTGCGTFQSRITNAPIAGPNVNWLFVDGFGMTGNGNYTLSYSLQ